MTEFAITVRPNAPVYETPEMTRADDTGAVFSNIGDESLYGAVNRVLGEKDGMIHILSHYGYAGWTAAENLLPATPEKAEGWLNASLMAVSARCLDVMTLPRVQGVPLLALPRGAVVGTFPDEKRDDGWAHVLLSDGREGYVTACHLTEKRFGEDYLYRDPEPVLENLTHVAERRKTETGGRKDFSLQRVLDRWYGGSEDAFRKALTDTARSYLGTQYRWAGRSSFGIDCSGLVSMCYLLNGVSIYRDASIVHDYAIRRLDLKWDGDGRFCTEDLQKMRPGDALYFPGHIAMYLGNGEYIHSTGKAGDNGVVINSLLPGAPRFRADLLKCLYAVGGVRTDDGDFVK